MKQLTINKLPSKTWYWLRVNETKLPWSEEEQILPAEQITEDARLSITGSGCCSKKIEISAAKAQRISVFMDFAAEGSLCVQTSLALEEGAHVRLIQLQHSGESSVVLNQVNGNCAKGACIELVQVYLGKGDLYSDTTIELRGDDSRFRSDIGYIGRQTHVVDMNEVVNHYGKRTTSDINVTGSLRDSAKKIFKGTIDFKTGASESVGNEQETVLMLGEDVENKTVPIILCSEENVVGNHGATIGELDAETLFYFASRGIGKEQAESIMARAGIERLKGLIGDEDFSARIDGQLGEV